MFGLGSLRPMANNLHDVKKTSDLYYLLNAFIGAYNRRTDVMERVIELDERLNAMRGELDVAGTGLDKAVKTNQPQGDR